MTILDMAERAAPYYIDQAMCLLLSCYLTTISFQYAVLCACTRHKCAVGCHKKTLSITGGGWGKRENTRLNIAYLRNANACVSICQSALCRYIMVQCKQYLYTYHLKSASTSDVMRCVRDGNILPDMKTFMAIIYFVTIG